MKFIDGAVRYNNPIRVLYDEAKSVWPGCPIACIISIGIVPVLLYLYCVTVNI